MRIDVPVVGQDHDLVDPERLDRLQQLRGAGVHGLTAVDDGVAAEVAEELLVAGAGHDGDDDTASLTDIELRRGRRGETLVALARLRVHVVDLHVADGPVLERFAEHHARVVDVDVHLDRPRVAHDESAVAERQEKRLERLAVDGVPGDQEARAVAVLRELARFLDDHAALRPDARLAGLPDGAHRQPGAGGDPAAGA